MPASTELRALAYIRKHPTAPAWHVVTVKEPNDANTSRAWELLARDAAEVKPSTYSLRFARF